jgi:peroxiredoxin
MTISVGSALPEANLLIKGEGNPEAVSLSSKLRGRNVVIFGLPGAFTGTCTTAHLPSFVRTRAQLAAKGVDEVICVAVNDPFVMQAWGISTGAVAAGVTLLADADGSFTKAIGMDFTAPGAGFFGRSNRYALHVVDGVVQVMHHSKGADACEIAGGEAMLDAI